MCGIYGAITQQNKATQLVFKGLKRLEYRGYDSWGVAVAVNHQLIIKKYPGKISAQEKLILPQTNCALGHTRWATHGNVSKTNAHPHLAVNHAFALVHNGMVENYQLLKNKLLKKAYQFNTTTDTEVIVALIEMIMKKNHETEPSWQTASQAFAQLKGRNTIALLSLNGQLIALRNGSPLIIGRKALATTIDYFITSDVLSVSVDADEYLTLDHNQGVMITTNKFNLYEVGKKQALVFRFKALDLAQTNITTDGYDHFMLKEIYQQATALINVTDQPSVLLTDLLKLLKQSQRVFTLGAGSAYYAALATAHYFRQFQINAVAIPAYEYISYFPVIKAGDVCLVFSQSGETADTNEAVEKLIEKKVIIASIVNMLGSTLSAISHYPFMLQVGPELGVASTKALTGQLIWGQLITSLLKGQKLAEFRKKVQQFQQQLIVWFEGEANQQLRQLAANLLAKKHLYVLGRGQLLASTLEFALKMKEISYLHAEGFSAGELKHGVMALIEKDTPVFCLMVDDQHYAEMLSAAAQVKARGARVIGVAANNNELFDDWLKTPATKEFAVIANIIPAQLLSYHLATAKGYDPDRPRNLAKSVTVK